MPQNETTEANTVIWSGEHRAYWRPEACGYTQNVAKAGIWPYAEAERMTRHCGPEKLIQLRLKHEVPEFIALQQKRAALREAVWVAIHSAVDAPAAQVTGACAAVMSVLEDQP